MQVTIWCTTGSETYNYSSSDLTCYHLQPFLISLKDNMHMTPIWPAIKTSSSIMTYCSLAITFHTTGTQSFTQLKFKLNLFRVCRASYCPVPPSVWYCISVGEDYGNNMQTKPTKSFHWSEWCSVDCMCAKCNNDFHRYRYLSLDLKNKCLTKWAEQAKVDYKESPLHMHWGDN